MIELQRDDKKLPWDFHWPPLGLVMAVYIRVGVAKWVRALDW